MALISIYHRNWDSGRMSRYPSYVYESDRVGLEEIFRDNNAVTGDPGLEVNVRMYRRSLSMGDVVQIGDTFWLCEAIGWSQTTKEELWPDMTTGPTDGRGTSTTNSSQETTKWLVDMLKSSFDKSKASLQKLSRGPWRPPTWWE